MKSKYLNNLFLSILFLFSLACNSIQEKEAKLPLLKISSNNRFLVDDSGDPFFWLGDTGWLLFKKLNRENAKQYLESRKNVGYNVVQAMLIHDIGSPVNIYGDSAFVNKDFSKPMETEGNQFNDVEAYDYWDHVDYIIKLAGQNGIYVALVPVWGSNVRGGHLSAEQAKVYGSWLANRYMNYNNIIWLNGGDTRGDRDTEVWKALANSIREKDNRHLITFHPFGRTQSSSWFHNEEWLDFNMFQSGHQSYIQDVTNIYGEDNWKYVQYDYNLQPVKPTIDGEPSYEDIPQGLHDTLQPRWKEHDIRRYAYWSVFAGAFGHTYGHNSVMQFYNPQDIKGSYGAKEYWQEALNAPGASQLRYLKSLMLSRPFLNRIPDQSLIVEDEGERYEYLVATRGNTYAFVYTYNGRNMKIQMGKIQGEEVVAQWFDPRTGNIERLGVYNNKGQMQFDPPGEVVNGNDWVLILDTYKE